MRFIPTKIHGILDYTMGLLLIATPWILGFANNEPATWILVALGAGVILYSLLTDYELGVARVISMPGHLALDAAAGVLLAASPWLFGFADAIWIPHVVLGVLELGAALTTKTQPTFHGTGGKLAHTT